MFRCAAWLCVMSMWAGAVAAEPLVDLSKEAIGLLAKVEATGQTFELDMGTQRVNWNNARWSVLEFAQPRDLGAFGGLKLVVSTEKPRIDAGVYIALREADGTWYVHGWAADLAQTENTSVVRFDNFTLCEWYKPEGGTHHDENAMFDRDKVTAVAIGCVNPLGVGQVRFTIKELSLVKLPEAQMAPAKVQVSGKLLAVEDQEMIPAAVFGYYNRDGQDRLARYRMAMDRRLHGPAEATKITHVQVGCFGERMNASVRLSANWQQIVAKAAQGWVEKNKARNQRTYAEYWNEPYLNWANYVRASLNPSQYDQTKATEGGPVHIKSTGEEMPHLKWTKDYDKQLYKWCQRKEWRRGLDAKGNWVPNMYGKPGPWGGARRRLPEWNNAPWPPEDVKDGEKYKATVGKAEVELTATTPWHIYDETQFTYWSGKGMLKLYIEPALAFGKALKAAEPGAMYFVGWGFRPGEDHWAGWDMLYKPTIDALIQVADGIHEHDYGGDPLKLPANYEVMQAYAQTKYNKRLVFINTEQASMTDPQAMAEAAGLSKEGAADLNKFRWAARKTMLSLSAMPDKVFGACNFGESMSETGELLVYEALMNLRGRLAQVSVDDPGLFAVASIDGTDPLNPRMESMPQRKELVLAVWNDHRTSRPLELNVAAPRGTSFDGQAILRSVILDKQTSRPKLQEQTATCEAQAYALKQAIEPLSLLVVTLPLKGEVDPKPQARRRQFFGKSILANVTPQSGVQEIIAIDEATLKGAKRAWVRFVAERLAEGEGEMVLNGKTVALPSCLPPENAAWIREITIPVADLKASNDLSFRQADAKRAGYLLAMNSIIVESD